MSHFIAHTIKFSKDLKTFKCKGGDNNVIPRSNSWTKDIPIEELYYNVQGGMLKLTDGKDLNILVNKTVNLFKFGSNPNYYIAHHEKENEETIKRVEKFDKQFLDQLKSNIKNLSLKKDFIIELSNNRYIKEKLRSQVYPTSNKEQAQKFSFWKAKHIEFLYRNYDAKIIDLRPLQPIITNNNAIRSTTAQLNLF